MIPIEIEQYRIAVLLPYFNEELTVGKTIAAFRQAVPTAAIYVYDNNSKDNTVTKMRQEVKRPVYLSIPPISASGRAKQKVDSNSSLR
jgi:glycosyltransferase involved in cell wall biosynthesis